jgi:hypothetical protein
MLELVLGQAAFQEGARIDAGRCVALHEHHVAGMIRRRGAPEVIEAHFVQRGRRRVGRQVSAVFARLLVRVQDHRQRIPANAGFDALLHLAVAGIGRFLAGPDGVEVRRIRTERQIGARAPRVVDELLEQEVRAFRALRLENRIDRFDPLARLDGIEVFELHDFRHTDPFLERDAGKGRAARCASMRREVIEVRAGKTRRGMIRA